MLDNVEFLKLSCKMMENLLPEAKKIEMTQSSIVRMVCTGFELWCWVHVRWAPGMLCTRMALCSVIR